MSASYIAALETDNYRLRAENKELKNRLRDIIKEAVQEAIQPLQDRIESQDDRIAAQDEKITALTSTQEQDVNRICLDIAYDRQRISRLEHPTKNPGKTETARAEKIDKYLASRSDHRATFETLKGHLGVDNDLLGIAIRSLMLSGKYAIIKTPGDKRKRTLVMLPR